MMALRTLPLMGDALKVKAREKQLWSGACDTDDDDDDDDDESASSVRPK